MSKCGWCHQEMLTADGCCVSPVYYPDGTSYPQILCTEQEGHRCHDCGAQGGSPHHPHCDMERCPKCRASGIPDAQLISCGCLETAEDKALAATAQREWKEWERKRKEQQYG
jgi:hypothetical protein